MQPLQFSPITLESRVQILPFLQSESYRISDITFGNLYIWKHAREISYAIYADTLIIQTRYAGENPYFFFPIGRGDKLLALRAIESYAKAHNFPLHFASLESRHTAIIAQAFPYLTIESTPDRFDYVYSVDELICLNGRKFHKKKNHLNHFLAHYAWEFHPITQDSTKELMSVARLWLDNHPSKTTALELEHSGICAALAEFDALGLVGGFVRARAIDSDSSSISSTIIAANTTINASKSLDSAPIVAFSFGERMSDEMVVIHIEKAAPQILGAYQIINQQLLARCFANYTYANREEDLGIAGLRQAKKGYNPVFMVEKFRAK